MKRLIPLTLAATFAIAPISPAAAAAVQDPSTMTEEEKINLAKTYYLEAEAAGVRATGIGCFFDDAVHSVLGLTDLAYQSLYHFTVGGPVDDPRLRTHPPYAHLGAHLGARLGERGSGARGEQ